MSASRLLVISLTLLIAPNVLSAQEGCGDHAPHEELGRSNLRNRSPHRSPIHIGGYVTFRDNTAENIRYYWGTRIGQEYFQKTDCRLVRNPRNRWWQRS